MWDFQKSLSELGAQEKSDSFQTPSFENCSQLVQLWLLFVSSLLPEQLAKVQEPAGSFCQDQKLMMESCIFVAILFVHKERTEWWFPEHSRSQTAEDSFSAHGSDPFSASTQPPKLCLSRIYSGPCSLFMFRPGQDCPGYLSLLLWSFSPSPKPQSHTTPPNNAPQKLSTHLVLIPEWTHMYLCFGLRPIYVTFIRNAVRLPSFSEV